MMRVACTNRVLVAIIIAASYVEAGGIDAVQGYEGKEAEEMFEDIIRAGAWARQELERRSKRKAARR